MSRLGLRQIRKPNIHGAAFVVEAATITLPSETEKQVTNGEQTGNKEVTERVTNGEQTGNKEVTNPKFSPTSTTSPNHKRVTERVTSNRVNRIQTGNKEVTNPTWDTLRGHEARLLKLIFDECRATGDLLSPPLTLDRIAACLESHKGTAKTITVRLVQKGVVTREASATGRGGFTRFRLEKSIYQSLLIRETDNKQRTNREQTGNKEVTERVTERVTSIPSSSSSIDLNQNLKTTTTGEVELFDDGRIQLAPDWAAVDFSALADVGFSRAHLTQLAKHGKLSSSEVQDSIHFFAFDLRRNGKGRELKGPPLNFFMGILRKGLPYAPPENYESPETEARHKYLEGKRRLEERRLAEERELKALAFAEWRRGLTEADARDLVPDAVKDIPRAREASLNVYFDEQVYPGLEVLHSGEDATLRAQVRATIEQSLGEVQP